jgi:gamma-glutamyl:cysteine ligase YbdK (ATP-grasp superfamily)
VGSPDSSQPVWSRWNSETSQRYTLGIEEEVMLLEPDRWSPAQSSDEVLAALSDELAEHTSPETNAAVIELATGVHTDVDGACTSTLAFVTREGGAAEAGRPIAVTNAG